jgi:hypothetical protein
MRIMGFMKRDNHLDPEVFDLFVSAGVYRDYAKRFLPESLIDDVDEAQLLAIVPKPMTLPDAELRKDRTAGFLPEYRRKQSTRPSLLQTRRLPTSLAPKPKP